MTTNVENGVLHAEASTLAGTAEQVGEQLINLKSGQVVAWVLPESSRATEAAVEVVRVILGLAEPMITHLNEKTLASLVETLVPRSPAPPSLLKEAVMIARARKAVIEGASWLTTAELAKIAGLSENNPSAQPSKWKKSGSIFAISHGGVDLYPGYGLDPDQGYRPVSALKSIIKCFKGTRSAWALAYWFESVNSYLGGKSPKDLLSSAPSKVLEAAADEMAGVIHS